MEDEDNVNFGQEHAIKQRYVLHFFHAAVFSFFGPCYTTTSLERPRRVKIDLVTNGNPGVALDAKGVC